jgi:hypothetical protein
MLALALASCTRSNGLFNALPLLALTLLPPPAEPPPGPAPPRPTMVALLLRLVAAAAGCVAIATPYVAFQVLLLVATPAQGLSIHDKHACRSPPARTALLTPPPYPYTHMCVTSESIHTHTRVRHLRIHTHTRTPGLRLPALLHGAARGAPVVSRGPPIHLQPRPGACVPWWVGGW